MTHSLPLSLCNELLAADGHELAAQCRIAAALGYVGLELAPGTLVDDGRRPHELGDAEVAAIRRTIDAAGLVVSGLHWLLAPYPELSITDPAKRASTRDTLVALVRLCAALGGEVLVHGSPAQRLPPDDVAPEAVREHVVALFGEVAAEAERAGVLYCLEPLSRAETPFVNTLDEALEIVDDVDSTAFRTMIDTSAAGQAETVPVAALLARHLPDRRVAHVQLNDTNRGAPGTGSDPFEDIVAALHAHRPARPCAIEPFVTVLDASTTAAIAIATVRAHERHLGGGT